MLDKPDKHYCQLQEEFNKGPKYPPNLTIYTFLRRKLREWTTIHPKHPDTNFLFRGEHQINEERSRHIRSSLWLSIHPYSQFAVWWRVFMSVIYVIVIIGDLTLTTIEIDTDYYRIPIYLYRACNDMCGVDMVVNLFIGYVKKYKFKNVKREYAEETMFNVELKKTNIAVHYLRTFFFIDLVFLLILVEQYFKDVLFSKQMWYYLLPLRLLRYARFYTVFKTLKKITHDEVYSVLCCVFLFMFLIYFCGCMHILLPRIIRSSVGTDRPDHLAQKIRKRYKELNQPVSDAIIFMHAMYESFMTLFGSVAFNPFDSSLEAIFIYIMNIFLGMALMIYIFLTILHIMYNREMSTLKYYRFGEQVANFYWGQQLDLMTRKQIAMFLQNTFRQEFFDESAILATVTHHLRYEIFLETSMDLVRNCDLFNNIPDDVMASLTVMLKYETHMPGVKIINAGELSTCMFFIASGTVAVYGSKGREICHLADGAYFGEIGLLDVELPKRVADVVCIEYCQLYRLDKNDFHRVIKPDSKIGQRIQRAAAARLKQRGESAGSTTRLFESLKQQYQNRKRTVTYIHGRGRGGRSGVRMT